MTTPPTSPDRSKIIPVPILWISAVLCFAAAAALVITAGLPDRASLNALIVMPDGRVVAPEVGAIAPPINLTTIDGDSIDWDDLRGQIVILNYWATWCAPCQVEMPALQAIANKYPGEVVVLGINAGEAPDAVRAWRARFGLTFPLLLDPAGTAVRDYRLRGQPTTVIVTPSGYVHAILYGPADLAALEQAIVALLPASDERDTP